MLITSPFLMNIRSIARKLGVTKIIGKIISNSHYEDKFGPQFKAGIKKGDMVWDIGANVGLYTASFKEAAGNGGHVVAFEPVKSCYEQLVKLYSNVSSITLKNMAIGNADGVISMVVESDPLAATHRISLSNDIEEGNKVEIRSAESIVIQQPHLFPNVVKIDVEGHEGMVLEGMKALFPDKRLHCIGIEVHFDLLESRGDASRPKQMEQLLKSYGFSLRWTDPSHLIATR